MIDGVTTAELIRRGARRFRDRTAVFCGDDPLTFGEVDQLATATRSCTARRSCRTAGCARATSADSTRWDTCYLVDRTSDMIVTGGYNVTAFVVGAGVTEAELIDHCRARLAAYKAPKTVRFVDEVPKSAVGKLLRRALRDPLWEGHERQI